MSTLNISAPQANETRIINLESTNNQINFNFDTSDAIFEKVDDSLEIYFSESDSTIVLSDFYLTYTSENMPDFLLSNELISSKDFFAALDASLMPAASNIEDPAAETRRNSTDNAVLATGITSLGHLEGGSEQGRALLNEGIFNTNNDNERSSDEQSFDTDFQNNIDHSLDLEQALSSVEKEESSHSGKVSVDVELDEGVEPGDKVVIKDQDGNTLFDDVVTEDMIENGVNVEVSPPEDEEEVELDVTVTDKENNTTTSSKFVDVTPPEVEITVNPITKDNIINAVESNSSITVTGKVTGEFNVNDTVTITVNNQTYTGTVNADGSYSIDVKGSDLAADSNISVSITTKDDAGNEGSAQISKDFEVDTQINAEIFINDITADNTINIQESQQDVTVTGYVTGDFKAGDKVTITVNEVEYETSVNADGSYSAEVKGSDIEAANGNISASIDVKDAAGNELTANTSHNASIDTQINAEIVFNTVAGDDILNAAEAGANVMLSGRVIGDYKAGDILTININGTEYKAMIGTDGAYYASVKGSDLAEANGEISASIDVKDAAGNEFTASGSHNVTVDTSDLNSEGISLKIETGDNDNLNNTEIKEDGTFDVTINLGKDVELNDTITVTFDGQKQEITVDQDMLDNGTINVSLKAPESGFTGEIEVEATITDKAGNTGSASDTASVTAPITELVNDFVSLNAGATATGNLLANEGEALDGATIISFEPAEGWTIVKWTSGEFVLTYNENPDYKVVVQPDGSYTFTTPGYEHQMEQIDINSVLKYTIEDKNGDVITASATFSSNATTEENIRIDGDFTDHTITITNVGSKDQNTYEYTTAGYEEGGQDIGEQELSALFLGSNDDKVEVTGTLGKGTDGVSHHIYGDELQNYEDAGDDIINVGTVSDGGNIRADGNLYNDVVGGDDTVSIGTVEGSAIITGDGWHLYSGSEGGADELNITNVEGGTISGDAYTLYANAKGGDDIINVEEYSGKTGSYIAGDAYEMHANSEGGDDQINIETMNGQSVYGEAYKLYGKGGDDNIDIDTMNSGSILGDASIAYNGSQAGNDTITVGELNGGNIYGDSNYEYAGAKSGSDSITVDEMNGGNIYADGLYGTKDDGGNDTVTVNEFGTAKVTVDGGLGEDTFVYGSDEDSYIDFTSSNINIEGTNANITNFENLSTGSGDDIIKISNETLDSVINTGEGFDIVYADDTDIQTLLENGNISNAEMIITGDAITGTNQDDILEELGITSDDGMITFDDSWSMTSAENGGMIFSNGDNEVWVNSNSGADTGLDTFTLKSSDLLGGTNFMKDFQDGNKLDLTELKDAGYEVSASNGDNGEGILTITDSAGDTAQTIIIPDISFNDDELRDADNIDFINM